MPRHREAELLEELAEGRGRQVVDGLGAEDLLLLLSAAAPGTGIWDQASALKSVG